MKKSSHNERCRDCKDSVSKMLHVLYGQITSNCDLDLPASLDGYKANKIYDALESIYSGITAHRGFTNFVRSKKLPRVDFFVPGRNLIIEFDESQHFTKPRDIALALYPAYYEPGYPIERWRTLCQKLNKRDNDPPFRDEQRAWYDTLRDFAPIVLGSGRTVRLYARDLVWCSLDPSRTADLQTFERLVNNNGEQK